jgi:hypothetical protein
VVAYVCEEAAASVGREDERRGFPQMPAPSYKSTCCEIAPQSETARLVSHCSPISGHPLTSVALSIATLPSVPGAGGGGAARTKTLHPYVKFDGR